MQNSSSLIELLSRLSCHSRAQRRSALDKFVRTAPRKDSGALAPDDVRTPLAELISESNHFLCCGSAINLVPHNHAVPSNGHADLIWLRILLESKIVCYRALEYSRSPISPWDGSTAASSFAAIVLGASVLFMTTMHSAPTPAQKTVRARRHNASVNPAVPVTPKILAISIFPPSYVPKLPGLNAPTRLITLVSASTMKAPPRAILAPINRRMM